MPKRAAKVRKKRRLKVLLALTAAKVVTGAGAYLFFGGEHVSTDNAYVAAIRRRSPRSSRPRSTGVAVVNTQVVRQGPDPGRLDDSDARLALAKAEADYLKARRQFAQTAATSGSLAAQASARDADIGQAQAQLGRAGQFRQGADRPFAPAGAGLVGRRVRRRTDDREERLFDCPVQPRACPRSRRNRVGNQRRGARELGRQRGADRRLDDRHQPRSRRRQGASWTRPGSISSAQSSARRSTASSPTARSRSASASPPVRR